MSTATQTGIIEIISGYSIGTDLLKFAQSIEGLAFLMSLSRDMGYPIERIQGANYSDRSQWAAFLNMLDRHGLRSFVASLDPKTKKLMSGPMSGGYTVRVANPPYVASNITYIDGLPNSILKYYHPATKDWKNHRTTDNGSLFIGAVNPLLEVSPLAVESVNNLPAYINSLLPKRLTVGGSVAELFDTSAPLTGNEPIDAELVKLTSHFGRTLLTSIALINPKTMIEKGVFEDTQEISAIKVKKMSGAFSVETITALEYKQNYNKYIIVADVPKQVLLYRTNQLNLKYETPVPTLIVPVGLLTSSSTSITATALEFVRALVNKSLDPLVLKDAYKEALKKYPEFTEHWDGLVKLVGIQGENLDRLLRDLKPQPTPSVAELNSVLKKTVQTPKFFALGKTLASMHQTRTKLEQTRNNFTQVESRLYATKDTITRYKEEVEKMERSVPTLETDLDGTRKAVESLNQKVATIEKAKEELAEEIKSTPVVAEADFARDVMFTGIVFTDGYRSSTVDMTDPRHVNRLRDALLSEKRITALNGYTTRPMVIYVDSAEKPRDQCNRIVAGPYTFELTFDHDMRPRGAIYLKSAASVFGMNTVNNTIAEMKAHPHSQPMKVDLTNVRSITHWLRTGTLMCLGEAEATIKVAAQNKDLESIRMIMTSWFSCAWSGDQWGAQWNWFPSPDKIKLQENP